MAGLLAARSLAEAYERVTVDRPRRPAGRPRGPQGGAAGPPRPRPAAARAGVPRRAAAGLQRRAGRGRGADLRGARGDALRDRRPSAGPRIDGRPARSSPAGRSSRATCAAASVSCPSVTLIDRCDALGLTAGRRRRAGHRRADPAPCRRQRRGDARGGPRRRRHRAARPASPPGSRRWATRAPTEERLNVDVTYASRRLSAARRPARRRQVRADRRPSGPPAHAVPVRPGGRALDPRARRLRPRAPSTERPRRLRRVCGHRRAARRARSDRGRRAARRDRDPSLPRQRPPPLRPPAQLPGGAAGRAATRSARSTRPTGRA